MKRYRLSGIGERIAGTLISAAMIVCMALLVVALRFELFSMILCLLASVTVAAILCFYVANLFKAACVPDPGKKRLTVKGFPDYEADLSETVSVETADYKTGPIATRVLLFKDAADAVTASVPTFFTANQGAQAEPLAMELAQALGIAFKPTLEPWEYDKEKRKEHEKELALAQKQKRAETLRRIKAKLLRKQAAGEPAPTLSEEEHFDFEPEVSDGINYDALDDEK